MVVLSGITIFGLTLGVVSLMPRPAPVLVLGALPVLVTPTPVLGPTPG
jgi:hypothetical protein